MKEVMIIENSHTGEWDLEMLKQEFDELIDLAAFGLAWMNSTNRLQKLPNC